MINGGENQRKESQQKTQKNDGNDAVYDSHISQVISASKISSNKERMSCKEKTKKNDVVLNWDISFLLVTVEKYPKYPPINCVVNNS